MSSVFGKFFGGGGAKNQTFVPSSAKLMGMIVNKQNAMHNQSSDTLGSGDMRAQVVLPDGEDKNEWLAINTIDCFNDICMLYNQVKDACTNESCPVMKAGSVSEYHWADGVKVKKPVKVPAREYVVLMTEWVEETLNDESIFPQGTYGGCNDCQPLPLLTERGVSVPLCMVFAMSTYLLVFFKNDSAFRSVRSPCSTPFLFRFCPIRLLLPSVAIL
jgi:hypothetical protein